MRDNPCWLIVTKHPAMPEGHTIHREARLQSANFVGSPLTVWSPQGRFSEGAGLLDGHTISSIEAWGKHLFYEWAHGRVLHIHLGLFGRFRRHIGDDPPPPTDGTRLAMSTDEMTLYLSGPTTCEVVDPVIRDEITSDLGPDPLRNVGRDEAVGHIAEKLGRRTVPVAAAMLDQAVLSGIGNVYRSEILFRVGVNPLERSRDVDEEVVEGIWDEAVTHLSRGERSGRIVTTDPEDVGRSRRSDIRRGERTYVYKRRGQPCRRCGAEIQRTEINSRKAWWCPDCQPR